MCAKFAQAYKGTLIELAIRLDSIRSRNVYEQRLDELSNIEANPLACLEIAPLLPVEVDGVYPITVPAPNL